LKSEINVFEVYISNESTVNAVKLNRKGKSNLAASRTAVLISKLVDKMETKVQRICIAYVFEVQLPNETSKMLYDQTRSETSNMAAFKSEVPKSKLVDKVGYPIGLTGVYCDLIPERVITKMASLKPEILTYLLEDKVGT